MTQLVCRKRREKNKTPVVESENQLEPGVPRSYICTNSDFFLIV